MKGDVLGMREKKKWRRGEAEEEKEKRRYQVGHRVKGDLLGMKK